MLEFRDYIENKIPTNLRYLLNTYCKEANGLTLHDLKQRHKEYLFNMIRILRRCAETQAIGVNGDKVMIFSATVELLTKCMEYYNKVDTFDKTAVLPDELDNFIKEYEAGLERLKELLNNAYRPLSRDLTDRYIYESEMKEVSEKAQPFLHTFTGHHVNLFLPYMQEDSSNQTYYGRFLNQAVNGDEIHAYGFGQTKTPEELFTKGRFIYGNRDRINIRSRQFDLVFTTHHSLFGGMHPKLTTAASYAKKEGAIALFGYSTDFELIDLKRISAAMKDVHVYFIPYMETHMLNDKLYCLVIGTVVTDKSDPTTMTKLLDQFVNHRSDEEPYTIFGSSETTEITFQSYDMSPEDTDILRDEINKTSAAVIASIIPKTFIDKRQPLLPFNAGQLGLILISGEINGVIREEKTGCCHVVKGSSCQVTRPTEELVLDSSGNPIGSKHISSTYATTNVTVILPDGEIRTLQ